MNPNLEVSKTLQVLKVRLILIPILFFLLVFSQTFPLSLLFWALILALLITLNLYLALKTPADINFLNYFGLTVEIILVSIFLWLAKTPSHLLFLIYILLIVAPALIDSLKLSLYATFWVILNFVIISLYFNWPILNWKAEIFQQFFSVISFLIIALLTGVLADKLRLQNQKLQKTIEDLKRTTKEKEIEKQKVKFLMETSHQLNTPVSQILNSSALLLEQKNLNQKEKKYLTQIKQSSQNLGQVLKKLISGFEKETDSDSALSPKELSKLLDEAELEIEEKRDRI